jgi:hypothetical protein
MTCRTVRPKLAGYLDGALGARDQARLSKHLAGCAECRADLEGYSRMAALLARAELPLPPADLALRIRLAVDAAREGNGWWKSARRTATRLLEDILEPLAVPATGGVAMSLLIYALILHSLFLGVPMGAVPNDPPLYVSQPARLQTFTTVPVSAGMERAPALRPGVDVVDFTVDAQGQGVSYEVLSGHPDRDTLRQLDNALLFSRFQPELNFGKPTAGGHVVVRFDEMQVRE